MLSIIVIPSSHVNSLIVGRHGPETRDTDIDLVMIAKGRSDPTNRIIETLFLKLVRTVGLFQLKE